MIGLDTNILLRWLVDFPGDEEQTALVRQRLSEVNETIFINPVVLAEATWTLQRRLRLGRQAIIALVSDLLRTRDVVLDRADTARAALEAYRTGPIGYNDHFLGLLNAEAGCRTTLTLDEQASRSAAFTLLTASP